LLERSIAEKTAKVQDSPIQYRTNGPELRKIITLCLKKDGTVSYSAAQRHLFVCSMGDLHGFPLPLTEETYQHLSRASQQVRRNGLRCIESQYTFKHGLQGWQPSGYVSVPVVSAMIVCCLSSQNLEQVDQIANDVFNTSSNVSPDTY